MQVQRYEFTSTELSAINIGHLRILGGVTFSLLARLGMPERYELTGDMEKVAQRLGVQNTTLLGADDLPIFSGEISEQGFAVNVRLVNGGKQGNISLVEASYFVHASPYDLPTQTERLFPDTSMSAMSAAYWSEKEDASSRQKVANSSVNLLRRLVEKVMNEGLPEDAQWVTTD